MIAKVTFWLTLILWGSVSVLAQGPRVGQWDDTARSEKFIGIDFASVDPAGVVLVRAKGANAGVWTLQTGVSVCGGLTTLGSTITDGFVVVGRNSSGGGIAEHWSYNPSTGVWSVSSAYVLPGADFSAVTHDGVRLYLLDCVSNTILRAPWVATQPLWGGTFTVWAGVTEAPLLVNAQNVSLMALSQANAPGLSAPGIFLVEDGRLLELPILGVLLTDGLGGVTASSYVYGEFQDLLDPVIVYDGLVDGASSVTVAATASDLVQILNAQGAVIGSGAAPAGGGKFTIPVSAPIQVGEVYAARSSVGTRVNGSRAVRRHGFPEGFFAGESLTRISLDPSSYHVGNGAFTIYCNIERPMGGPAVGYSGLIVVGFGGDPVVAFDNGQGINAALLSQFWFGVTGHIDAHAAHGYVKMSLPVPNDPGLEGLVMLAQFAIADPITSQLRLSEVIGYKLQAPQ